MKTNVKVAWADRVELTDGNIGTVVEFDTQPPYVIKVVGKDSRGIIFKRWIRSEEVAQILPKP